MAFRIENGGEVDVKEETDEMRSSLLEVLPEKGVYTLIILVDRTDSITVGRLGTFTFLQGYYAYNGSAMTSLRKRVERHAKKMKTYHWHIDFLLASNRTKLITVLALPADQNIECKVNKAFLAIAETSIPVSGFGASDCMHMCKSHLIYFGETNPKKKILSAYRTLFGSNVITASVELSKN